MVALYKLPCSRPGKVSPRTWPTRNGHSITAPCATAKPASESTPRKWKPRRLQHDARRPSHKWAALVATALCRRVGRSSGERLDTARRLQRLRERTAYSSRPDELI